MISVSLGDSLTIQAWPKLLTLQLFWKLLHGCQASHDGSACWAADVHSTFSGLVQIPGSEQFCLKIWF